MDAAAMKHMALNFVKLDKFERVDFRIRQKKIHFLLSGMSVMYVLTTPILEDDENATMEQIRKRNKWENDDYFVEISWKPNIWLMMHGTDNQEKDEKQSQNDKTGLGMEKTVKDKAKSKPESQSSQKVNRKVNWSKSKSTPRYILANFSMEYVSFIGEMIADLESLVVPTSQMAFGVPLSPLNMSNTCYVGGNAGSHVRPPV
ncbi:hypothetical protein Tco_0414863 [Tanacetum coccineum]